MHKYASWCLIMLIMYDLFFDSNMALFSSYDQVGVSPYKMFGNSIF